MAELNLDWFQKRKLPFALLLTVSDVKYANIQL